MRFRKRLVTGIDLLAGVPILLLRHRRVFLAKFRRCLSLNADGLRDLVLWGREVLAFERRFSLVRYALWIVREQVGNRRLNPGPAGTVADVIVAVDGFIPRKQVEAADAEFLMITSPEATLADGAIVELAAAARRNNADLVYSDEDAMSKGLRTTPRFKPELSLDLLRTEDYIGPVFLVRAAAAKDAMRTSRENSGCSPFELLLGLIEARASIVRVARVLVHWHRPRIVALSEEQRCAILRRQATLPPGLLGEQFASRVDCLVSIIIPTKDRVDLLKPCLDSLFRSKSEIPFEVIILDNRSELEETRQWLKSAASMHSGVRIVPADFPFNWSRLNNLGVTYARGNLLLFLNNDIEAIRPGWIETLADVASRPDVGVVGPLLYFPDNTVQHAGVVVGLGGYIDHVYAGFPADATPSSLFVSPFARRNVLAVTGACQMVEKAKFDRVGGFDESLPICGDIGLSLALIDEGLVNVYEPDAVLIHHESASRPRVPIAPEEMAALEPLASRYLTAGDPYFNPNLSLSCRMPALGCPASAGVVH